MQKQKGTLTLVGIIAIIVVAIIAFGGVFTYRYFLAQKEGNAQIKMNNVADKPVIKGLDFLFSIVNKNIKIEDKNTGNLIQEIPLNSELASYDDLSISDIVFFDDDINFDGYKDLEILSQLAATNSFYDYFIYNPSTKKFEPNKILTDLSQPSFDPKTKTIKTHAVMGCAGGYFGEEVFSFIDGKYILTQTRQGNCCSADDTKQDSGVTISELKNGKMEVTGKDVCL